MTTKEAIKIIEKAWATAKFIHKNGLNCEPMIMADEIALQALRAKEERENPKQLTIEEMLNMNAPVWLSCFMLDGSGGYWCICQEGTIICPSGVCFYVRDIPTWKFYRYQPKENEPCSKS